MMGKTSLAAFIGATLALAGSAGEKSVFVFDNTCAWALSVTKSHVALHPCLFHRFLKRGNVALSALPLIFRFSVVGGKGWSDLRLIKGRVLIAKFDRGRC